MATNKKRKPKVPQQVKVKPENYIRERARKLAIYECLVSDGWQDKGMAVVFVTRQRSNGSLVVGSYVVDTFCLGVKNSGFWFDIDELEYKDLVHKMSHGMDIDFTVCDPQLAFSIIYGAANYANNLGFMPHRDFQVTQYMLDPSVPLLDIEFGKDGQPFFIAGPYDNVRAIMHKLNTKLGDGNFLGMVPTTHYLGDGRDNDDSVNS